MTIGWLILLAIVPFALWSAVLYVQFRLLRRQSMLMQALTILDGKQRQLAEVAGSLMQDIEELQRAFGMAPDDDPKETEH